MKSLTNEQRYRIKIIVSILVIGFFVGFLFIYQDGEKYEGKFKDGEYNGQGTLK